MHIPEKGSSKEEILATLQAFKSQDMDWKAGKVWCYVYNPGEDPAAVTREAYMSFLSENGLDPSVFPSLLKLETDVVRAIITLLRGDGNAVGHLTSGGTESIMLAVVIVEADGKKAGLYVDDLLGQQQVVIKSLATHYRKVEGISAATILGDGTVAMILDVTELTRLAHAGTGHGPLPAGDTFIPTVTPTLN